MKKKSKGILYLVITLFIWSIIGIAAASNPVIKEPENLSLEAWSYYSDRPAHESFLIQNRDPLLVLLFIFSIIPEMLILLLEFLKK